VFGRGFVMDFLTCFVVILFWSFQRFLRAFNGCYFELLHFPKILSFSPKIGAFKLPSKKLKIIDIQLI
jgi:hypothetical protein